jgi:hypothetical protein
VLDGDELVTERGHLILGSLEDADEALGGADVLRGVTADLRQAGEAPASALRDRRDVGGELAKDGGNEALLLLEHGDEEVYGGDLRVAGIGREPLRGGDRLLGLCRESICLHRRSV